MYLDPCAVDALVEHDRLNSINVVVRTLAGDEVHSCVCNSSDTARYVKEEVRRSCGVPLAMQQLVHASLGILSNDSQLPASSDLAPVELQLVRLSFDERLGEQLTCLPDEAAMLELISKLADPNHTRARDGETPLTQAARKGRVQAIELLCSAGAHVDEVGTCDAALAGRYVIPGTFFGQGPVSATPLALAAGYGKLESVRCLFRFRADCRATLADGATPLLLAAQYGHEAVVRLLCEHQADCNQARLDGVTPLIAAVANMKKETSRSLCELGADRNKTQNDGATPIYIAAQAGWPELAECLCSFQVDLDRATNEGASPLHIAVLRGHEAVVMCLCIHRADANATLPFGETPLHLAAQECNFNLAILRCLCLHGADKNQPDCDGNTPLHFAAWHGRAPAVWFLCVSGVNSNQALPDARTALHLAAERRHAAVVRCLCGRDADMNCIASDGRTPLQVAAAAGCTEIFEFFREMAAR